MLKQFLSFYIVKTKVKLSRLELSTKTQPTSGCIFSRFILLDMFSFEIGIFKRCLFK